MAAINVTFLIFLVLIFILDVIAAMLGECKQKNLIKAIVCGVCFPLTWPPNLCHVNPKELIANQDL